MYKSKNYSSQKESEINGGKNPIRVFNKQCIAYHL